MESRSASSQGQGLVRLQHHQEEEAEQAGGRDANHQRRSGVTTTKTRPARQVFRKKPVVSFSSLSCPWCVRGGKTMAGMI